MRDWINLFEDTKCFDTLTCLFVNGPTYDGDIPSKTERDDLYDDGLIDRYDGWNWLSKDGVLKCIELGIDKKKK